LKINFYKYQGTGNDFILIDNRTGIYDTAVRKNVRFLCDRRFGIGADGLILMDSSKESDFHMKYFNSDGLEGSMCGNGGRCIVAYAGFLGFIHNSCTFSAIDGIHKARIIKQSVDSSYISLQLKNVCNIKNENGNWIVDTGSPHLVKFCKHIEDINVFTEGRKIRYSDSFEKEGINVNFVEFESDNSLYVRTYERGVENETLSCGTGVVASAIAAVTDMESENNQVNVRTKGGDLTVKFDHTRSDFFDIWLEGPVKLVFSGEIKV